MTFTPDRSDADPDLLEIPDWERDMIHNQECGSGWSAIACRECR